MSVIEYCTVRVRNAAREGARDPLGYILIWDLLALLLRQNGVTIRTQYMYRYGTIPLNQVSLP